MTQIGILSSDFFSHFFIYPTSPFLSSEFIERHNSSSPPPSYTLGHNAFSDLTGDEFQQVNNLGKYAPGVDMTARIKRNMQKKLSIGESEEEAIQRRLGARSSTSEDSADFDKNKDIPTSVDWVAKGAVTDVKNQGMCFRLEGKWWRITVMIFFSHTALFFVSHFFPQASVGPAGPSVPLARLRQLTF